ncbi:hypothetical protein [Micromonospora sp. NPDC049891]|uniref:hypothetical protein n=1 Tax=Micromonospora sp. NPDC049891 TaxID=3155655 RepID=UPI0033D128D8
MNGHDKPEPLTVAEVAARLTELRAKTKVERVDEVERRRLEVAHKDALAAIEEVATSRARSRKERERDEKEAAELAKLYRKASRSGARARLRADINRSAEVRALRVEMVRKASLWVGLPVLIAFGAWSTAGVQRGVTFLMGLEPGSAGWFAAWAVEPALIAIVAFIIVGRALLQSAGGDTDWKSWLIEVGFLATSLALNIAPSLAADHWKPAALVAESVGPLGAATTAFLIGLFNSYVAQARPWDGAPRLADLDLGTLPADAARAAELRQADAPGDALLTQALDAPLTQPVTQAVTHSDAGLTHRVDAAGDASVDALVRQAASVTLPAVTQLTHRIDAPLVRRGKKVMTRPEEPTEPADDADRDARVKAAADAHLTHGVSQRQAARDAGVDPTAVRREVNRRKEAAQQINGHSHDLATSQQ